jgi:hypothetical protein
MQQLKEIRLKDSAAQNLAQELIWQEIPFSVDYADLVIFTSKDPDMAAKYLQETLNG